MNLFTLADLRPILWKYSPIDKVPYVSATDAMKDKFDSYMNQVCERLLGRMKPRFTMRRVNVPVYDGTLTVPRELDGIDGIEMVTADGCPCHPMQIYSRFHEWAYPVATCCCNSAVFVLSDMVQTFRDPDPSTEGFKIKVTATETEGRDLYLQGGLDADWNQIFTTETLTFETESVTSDTIYTSLPRMQKQVTDNPIEIYSVDVATDDETLIAVYAPGERIPAYKRYRVPEWNGFPMARIFGKLAFNEVTADTDIPIPNNLGALKAALQALSYEDAADLERSDLLWARALSILDEERAEAEDAELPTFKVPSDFGCGSIPSWVQ